MVIVAIIAVVVSFLSFGFSIAAFFKSQRTQDKMFNIEQARENDRQLEKRSANLKAKLEHKFGDYKLNINNYGSSEARNIKVTLNKKPLSKFPNISPDPDADYTIGSDSTLCFRWKTSSKLPPPFDAIIKWSDDSGIDRDYKTRLEHPG